MIASFEQKFRTSYESPIARKRKGLRVAINFANALLQNPRAGVGLDEVAGGLTEQGVPHPGLLLRFLHAGYISADGTKNSPRPNCKL
jgi:hypothetical protein